MIEVCILVCVEVTTGLVVMEDPLESLPLFQVMMS